MGLKRFEILSYLYSCLCPRQCLVIWYKNLSISTISLLHCHSLAFTFYSRHGLCDSAEAKYRLLFTTFLSNSASDKFKIFDSFWQTFYYLTAIDKHFYLKLIFYSKKRKIPQIVWCIARFGLWIHCRRNVRCNAFLYLISNALKA